MKGVILAPILGVLLASMVTGSETIAGITFAAVVIFEVYVIYKLAKGRPT